MALAHETGDATVCHEAHGVEEAVAVQQGQPDTDDDSSGGRQDLVMQHVECRVLEAGGLKGVLASVAGDGHLGEAQDAHALAARHFDGGQDVVPVQMPGQWCLVEDGGANFDQSH